MTTLPSVWRAMVATCPAASSTSAGFGNGAWATEANGTARNAKRQAVRTTERNDVRVMLSP